MFVHPCERILVTHRRTSSGVLRIEAWAAPCRLQRPREAGRAWGRRSWWPEESPMRKWRRRGTGTSLGRDRCWLASDLWNQINRGNCLRLVPVNILFYIIGETSLFILNLQTHTCRVSSWTQILFPIKLVLQMRLIWTSASFSAC